MVDTVLDDLLMAMDELEPRLRDLHLLLDTMDRSAPDDVAERREANALAHVMLPLLRAAGEASGHLRTALLTTSAAVTDPQEYHAARESLAAESGAAIALREALFGSTPPETGETRPSP